MRKSLIRLYEPGIFFLTGNYSFTSLLLSGSILALITDDNIHIFNNKNAINSIIRFISLPL